jgi:hypothetical protein
MSLVKASSIELALWLVRYDKLEICDDVEERSQKERRRNVVGCIMQVQEMKPAS